MALSVPAMADRNSPVAKATTTTVTIVKTTSPTSTTKSEFVRANWRDGLRFWFRNWLGWPHIQILDPKPPVIDEPLKSQTDPNPIWMRDEPMRDHGGEEITK
jgi:hypothetical protein